MNTISNRMAGASRAALPSASRPPISIRLQRDVRPRFQPRFQRGTLLIEMIVAMLMALIVASALYVLMMANYTSDATVESQVATSTNARMPLDTIADTLRNGQAVKSGSTTVMFTETTPSSVTVYTNTDGSSTSRIYLSNGALLLQNSGNGMSAAGTASPAGATTIVSGVTSLMLTYYQIGGGDYAQPLSHWTVTNDPHAPSPAEWPFIGAVDIQAVVSSSGGAPRTVETLVRLRNSPGVLHPYGTTNNDPSTGGPAP